MRPAHLRSDRGDEEAEACKDEKESHCKDWRKLGVPSETARNAAEGVVNVESQRADGCWQADCKRQERHATWLSNLAP